MSALTVLRAADRRSQPWKNGGGETTEIFAYPPGSGIADFDWRVSIAEVVAPGPFSHFENVDRVLTILEGELELEISNKLVSLGQASPPHRFSADVSTFGTPIGGTVRDLNVMFRRGLWSADIRRHDVGPVRIQLDDKVGMALVVAMGSLTTTISGTSYVLGKFDVLLTPATEAMSIISLEPTQVIIISMTKDCHHC